MLDPVDRAILNRFQGEFPVCERPYDAAAAELGISAEEFRDHVSRMLADGTLTRFGPLYHAERMGGALLLAALKAPPDEFDRIAGIVNAMPEVAHNYEREHELNMWFVLATEQPAQIDAAVAAIEKRTGLKVYAMPKLEEFYVGLRFEV
jgi:DNA-binding Lrp family transcriptional regulator